MADPVVARRPELSLAYLPVRSVLLCIDGSGLHSAVRQSLVLKQLNVLPQTVCVAGASGCAVVIAVALALGMDDVTQLLVRLDNVQWQHGPWGQRSRQAQDEMESLVHEALVEWLPDRIIDEDKWQFPFHVVVSRVSQHGSPTPVTLQSSHIKHRDQLEDVLVASLFDDAHCARTPCAQ